MNTFSNAIAVFAISYILFLIALWKCKQLGCLRLFDQNGFASNKSMLLVLHVMGIFLFGIIPEFTQHPVPTKFFQPVDLSLLSTWVSILLIISTVFVSLRIADKKFSGFTPNWDYTSAPKKSYLFLYFVLRIAFIFFYETWFRGYLLNDSVAWLGVFWAVAINVILYSILHIVNGREEALGTIPFGMLLCILTIWQGALWPAIFIHLALSIPYEFSIIKKNERLKISST